MARQAPATALSQAQWDRRPVAQRGQTPQLEQEWRATGNPNREVVPGEMRSDREDIPAGFTKADADKAETMEAALAGNARETRALNARETRALAAPGCQVYWPAPYEVCGAIRDKYNELGGPNSFLLFPKTNELTNPDGIGKRTEFLNGPIYWSPQGGAHPVVNHFLAAWARHGYENSYIGYPTTDEIINPDGVGIRQHFTGSTIYFNIGVDPLNAYSIGGAIADKWHEVSAELPEAMLGYPITDERVLPDGVGRMNRFEHGVIYWHPTTGAHIVIGGILETWSTAGFELSVYGYPVAEQSFDANGQETQEFQHGTITRDPNMPDGPHYRPYGGDKEVGDNYEVMSECLQRLRDDEEYLTVFPLSGGQILDCGTLKYIARKHFQDRFYIPRADWHDFQECVAWTLADGQEMDNVTQSGSTGRTRYNKYGDVRSYVVYNIVGLKIVNAFTSGDTKDWGGCVKKWYQ